MLHDSVQYKVEIVTRERGYSKVLISLFCKMTMLTVTVVIEGYKN